MYENALTQVSYKVGAGLRHIPRADARARARVCDLALDLRPIV
jgi:hypothetical protein